MQVDIVEEYEPDIIETEEPPQLIAIEDKDGICFNPQSSTDRRLRRVVYDKIRAAKAQLPDHLDFVIYEAYRPRSRQIRLWNDIWDIVKKSYPGAGEDELALRCNTFVANPYKVGSGHQFGCAVDITLLDTRNNCELDMGCEMQAFCDTTKTLSTLITESQAKNRRILCEALQHQGVINYPSEWWHFSYGDRLWAILTGRQKTLYAPLRFG